LRSAQPGAYVESAGNRAIGLSFIGNTFGDTTAGGRSWIEMSGAFLGLAVIGNVFYLSKGAKDDASVKVGPAGGEAASFHSNWFHSPIGIDFGAGPNVVFGASVTGNSFSGVAFAHEDNAKGLAVLANAGAANHLDTYGNLGIGTPTPQYPVDINGTLAVRGHLTHLGPKIGFYGQSPIAKPAVSGATGGNAALQSLITKLAALGLITNSTT
jgi:hypothetical protein